MLENDAVPSDYRKQGITLIRRVSEWKWWEYSTLTSWGANDQTPLVNIKNLEAIDDTVQFLEKMLKGNYTDERLKKIEETYNILKALIQEPQEPTHDEPGDSTQLEPLLEVFNKYKLYSNGKND